MHLRSTDTLEIVLAGAKSTVDMDVIVEYEDVLITDGKEVSNPDRQVANSNGVTAVTICSAPTAPAIRRVKSISVYNADDASGTPTIQLNVSGTAKKWVKRSLAVGKSMIYGIGDGKWGDGSTTGALTFSGNISAGGDLAVTGNETVGGTLGVTGASTIAALSATTGVFSGALSRSAANAITAFAGGGQASATALTKDNNRITTCATNGDSVKLPAATAGKRVWVKNSGAATLAIFPASGEAINALAADASISLATVKSMLFCCSVAGTWDTMLTA